MEIGKKYKKTEEKCYAHLSTFTETSEHNKIGVCEANQNLGLKPKRAESLGLEGIEDDESNHQIISGLSSQLVTQRRLRKRQISKDLGSRLNLTNSNSKYRPEASKMKHVVRITDLIRLFFDKVIRNSPFRQPVHYDPYENEFNYAKHQFIKQIENIHVPKIAQNTFISAEIFFILLYIFVFPLSTLFQEVEDSALCFSLKILGIVFCLLDILELFRGFPHSQKQNISLEDYNKNISQLKLSIATQLLIITLTIISLVLSQMHIQEGCFFFVGMALNIKLYLNQISKLQSQFFTVAHREKYWDLIKVLGMNLIVCHLLACALIGIASIRPDQSWMVTNDIISAPWWEQYIWSYYFGTTIILTIGFGDLHPGNCIEAFFIIIISFCACLFFGYNINYIGNLINLIKQEEVEMNDKLKVFNSLAKRTAVSKPTFQEISNYIVQSSKIRQQFNYAQERQLIQELPDGLRSSFLAEANIKLFNNLRVFISFTNKSIERLSLNIQAKICHPDQIIKKASQPYSLMILQSGDVGFVANKKESRLYGLVIERISNTIKQESKLICADLLQNQPLTYDIKSLTYSTVYVMDKIIFEQCIRQSKDDYEVYREVLDKCRFKLNEFGISKCRFCEKQHTLFECPRLHFSPFKKTLPLKYNRLRTEQRQKRVSFKRNKQEINYYDYASAATFEQNMNYSGLAHSESSSFKNTPKKRVDGHRNSFNHSFHPRTRESFLFTMEMVTQIREDIQKLKVENVAHEFTLWEITDCDELYDFKYYFPKSNPSHLDHKYSHLKNSKNYKRKLLKKIS